MSAWEYKYITSGRGGFATPVLMESFLNQLGQEEWEILYLQPQPDNPLAFSGLARRSTQREWNLENAVSAAARAEADKLRAEFEAKFRGAGGAGPEADKPEEGSEAHDGEFRKPRDTERDLDPELADEDEADEWDKVAREDELPTFFEAIQPLMRRNQRGEGVAVGVDHLAKKWNLSVDDVVSALKECGFAIPEDEDARPAYVEYDGDLFWLNVNRRGEMWVNSKEKPRPVFRTVAGRPVPEAEDPVGRVEGRPAVGPTGPSDAPVSDQSAADSVGPTAGRPSEASAADQRSALQGSSARHGNLPEGEALLQRIVPLMRRERGGEERSGSVSFLSRALRCREKELIGALEALGLKASAGSGEPSPSIDMGGHWSLNRDRRGGIWINLNQRTNAPKEEEPAGTTAGSGVEAAPSPLSGAKEAAGAPLPQEQTQPVAPVGPTVGRPSEVSVADQRSALQGSSALSASRLLLKPTRTGAVAGEIGRLAESVGKGREEFLSALVAAGLSVPEKPREKPVFVEQAGEIFWLNKNGKGELWLNAKASKR